MPVRKIQPRPKWFRLRCLFCIALAGMVWLAVARLARVVPVDGSGLNARHPAQAGAPGADAMPPGRPARGGLPIVIDPGHGGRDPGKPAGEQLEKTWTLKVALALAEELRRRGWPVDLTRADDATLSLGERSEFSNRAARRAFISIHFNSGGPDASGLEVYHAWPKSPETMARLDLQQGAPPDDRGQQLAAALQSAACAATGSRNRGVRNDPGLAVLNRTLCPSVLVECGFLTNAAECASIQSDDWRAKLVTGLADGTESWLLTSQNESRYP